MARPKRKTSETGEPIASTLAGLLEHLTETGTGRERIEAVESFISRNPERSPEELYEHFHAEWKDTLWLGTLEKIGKYVHGDDFEVSLGNTVDAKSTIEALNQQISTLRTQLNLSQVQHGNLMRENAQLRHRLKVFESESEWDQVQQSHAELALVEE